MSFPDITKASGAVKRVFSVIDREPSINPNTGSGTLQHWKIWMSYFVCMMRLLCDFCL